VTVTVTVTTLYDSGGVLGRPLDTSLLGSHNFMVTARDSRVALRPLRVEIERSTILQPTCEEKSGLS